MHSTQMSKLSTLEVNYKTKDKHYENCLKYFSFQKLGKCQV